MMFDTVLAALGLKTPAPSPPHPLDPPSVQRARSMVGKGKYRLGAGGKVGTAPHPFDENGQCDCSGFASWAWGLDRHQPWGYIWTNGLVADARGPQRHFALVGLGAEVRPGDCVVYAGGEPGGPKVGHVGLIVAVPPGWHYSATADLAALRIVHCAASGSVAVRESDGRWWARRGIVARLKT